ncbi:MAG: DUF364 domain-containing protein [Armatimonadota bacterium]|nr:DUF364 domain-containing protein [Armatimonadota bacterium]MDR7439452.1 DUF364 domain-containing protein [Armatimonadota bacterium]MDR7562905.1 DUF364 domain-containing protein [Armatimonadota bacterium]MDR7568403.1 DUF364 domain-containing protein [Armatimonadota bacterium]MDR7601458.1 DUF364 domain-containing protein [Armatimonadota bacterium]
MQLIEACLKALSARLGDEPVVVQDARVGVFYTAVALDTGHVGVAFTPRGLADTVCCPRSAASAPPAGRLVGRDAWTLAADARSPVALRRAVGVATLNALSALAMDRFGVPGGVRIPGLDALEAAGVSPEDRVALVGAFSPFIKSLMGTVSALWVVDRHPEALREAERSLWRPPESAAEVLREATVVVITGSALVEGGMDELLDSCPQARRVVLAGPTASPWPEPFFQRGVHILGGIRVLDGPRLVRIVGEGGSGYFFQEAAEKVCLVREDVAPLLLSLREVRKLPAQEAARRS